MDLPQRFWSKVDKTGPLWQGSPCWLWLAQIRPDGYGAFRWQGRMVLAHGLVYEATYGPVPAELEIDHLCRVRHCVNPAHLEAVPHLLNVQRGKRMEGKAEWLPCVVCGDPDGHVPRGQLTPWRGDGVLFGLEGALCKRCYSRLAQRQKRQEQCQGLAVPRRLGRRPRPP